MKKLGHVLVERGWLTHQQLLKAIDQQQARGGHLGTCLLELGLVSEDRLVQGLSLQLGVPAAGFDQLRGIPDEVYELLPAKLAVRARAVPFAEKGTALSVAMVEVGDLLLIDELSFVTGRRVVPHVANEARIHEALEKYFGAEMPPRFVSLCDRLNRSRFLWNEEETPAASEVSEKPRFQPLPRLPAPEARSAFDSDIAMTLPPPLPHLATPPTGTPSVASASVPVAVATAPPRAAAITRPVVVRTATQQEVIRFAAQLEVLADRDQVGEQLIAFFRRLYARALVFMIRKERVCGWLGGGDEVHPDRVAGFSCGLNQPSIFLNLHQGAPHYEGPLPPLPIHRSLAQIWGGRLPPSCVLLPIRLKDRLVAIVYADGRLVSEGPDVALLQRVTIAAGAAFELCIVQRKAQSA